MVINIPKGKKLFSRSKAYVFDGPEQLDIKYLGKVEATYSDGSEIEILEPKENEKPIKKVTKKSAKKTTDEPSKEDIVKEQDN